MKNQQLSLDLIEAQYNFKNSKNNKNSKSLLIIIGGIELTKKSNAIKKLSELMDPRYLKIKADLPNKIKSNSLIWSPYINDIPKRGEIVTFYGNWYTDLLASTLYENTKKSDYYFKEHLEKINIFENYLKNNNIDIVKVWFDLPWSSIKIRVSDLNLNRAFQRVPNHSWDNFRIEKWKTKDLYNKINFYRKQFTDDWYIIDSQNNKERNLAFANIVLSHLKNTAPPKNASLDYQPAALSPLLTQISKGDIERVQYKKMIKILEHKVAEALRFSSKNVVFAFEGMDAAGKGSSIKRLIKYLDPYEYSIHSISAPENFEKLRPYLWRFWNKHTVNGEINIFDRTWYGRVLVERIECLITEAEWQTAYEEINHYEKQLTETNTIVLKFWLAISKDEQLIRFEKRQKTPQKHFKITDDDWRNRDKWDAYLQAASDMFKYTNTEHAPWHIISNDNKLAARIEILQTILKSLQTEIVCK